jgi:hypothetical protein
MISSQIAAHFCGIRPHRINSFAADPQVYTQYRGVRPQSKTNTQQPTTIKVAANCNYQSQSLCNVQSGPQFCPSIFKSSNLFWWSSHLRCSRLALVRLLPNVWQATDSSLRESVWQATERHLTKSGCTSRWRPLFELDWDTVLIHCS